MKQEGRLGTGILNDWRFQLTSSFILCTTKHHLCSTLSNEMKQNFFHLSGTYSRSFKMSPNGKLFCLYRRNRFYYFRFKLPDGRLNAARSTGETARGRARNLFVPDIVKSVLMQFVRVDPERGNPVNFIYYSEKTPGYALFAGTIWAF